MKTGIETDGESPPIHPSYDETARFIAALTGSPDTPMTWQLLPDGPVAPEHRSSFQHEYHQPLAKVFDTLSVYNAQRGCGVFLMVNEGSGARRSAESVTNLRSLFVDDDRDALTPAALALPPSAVVQSRRGVHVYWFLERGEPLELFTPAQEALNGRLGTDTSIKDLPRLMRAPGFLHMKNLAQPFLVTATSLQPANRYTVGEVMKAFEIVPDVSTLPRKPSQAVVVNSHRPRSEREVLKLLKAIGNSPIAKWMMDTPEAVTRDTWRGVAMNVAATVAGHPELETLGRDLFHELSAPDRRYRRSECDQVFSDAIQFGKPMNWPSMTGLPSSLIVPGTTNMLHAAQKGGF